MLLWYHNATIIKVVF